MAPMSTDYVLVSDAAVRFGVPVDKIIERIRAGELEGEKRQDGWYVRLPSALAQAARGGPDKAVEAYTKAHEKSVLAGVLLALFLGPVGALYGSPLGGAILILATIGLAVSGLGVAAGVLGWVVALFMTPAWVYDHNKRVQVTAELLAGRK